MVTGWFWNAEERRVRALWRLILHALLLIACSFAAFLMLAFVFGFEGRANYEDPWTIVAGNVLLVVSVLVAGTFLDRRRLADFGLRIDRVWMVDLVSGMVLATLCLLVMFVFMLIVGWVEVNPAAISQVNTPWIAAWFVAFAFVGIGEEMLSRGYYLRNMAEGFHSRFVSARAALVAATFLSSVLFGLFHLPNPNMTVMSTVNLCTAGFVLALPVLLTGRLGFAVGFHVAWNFVLSNILGFPVSGIALRHTVLRVNSTGPDWITGGVFGPEGGVIGLTTNAFAAVLIVLYARASEGRIGLATEWTRYRAPTWRRKPSGSAPAPRVPD